ncbi:unnamed protein product [Cylicocyclus nassatus]|uniref:MARVEL domain-containing protein n=1 Tax=Cylicocyclus nassatus TaxID=53992 RepID=A0AA36GMQ4_CYLNA|nr:unnamed protein product [Cylicocyclus nassatus]
MTANVLSWSEDRFGVGRRWLYGGVVEGARTIDRFGSYSTYKKIWNDTKYAEDKVYGCGMGQTNKYYCCGPYGCLRILEILLCLIVISLITSVFGPGPFKGVLFGQTLLLIFAGVAMCFTFIFLIVYFFTLNETHLDFWPWRTTDLVFSATCCFSFIILAIVEAYYSTGSWSNNCNDIGSDGLIHNGCRLIYEWAFASFLSFILACLYGVSAFLASRDRSHTPIMRDY